MAATINDLLSTLRSGRAHYGFGQEPVPPKRRKPPNTALALFVQEKLRAPENQAELDVFMKNREGKDRQV